MLQNSGRSGFFPLLARIDEEIAELEAAIIGNPTNDQLQRLFGLKRQLVAMRKVVTPQRDLFGRSIDQLAELPGLALDERDYVVKQLAIVGTIFLPLSFVTGFFGQNFGWLVTKVIPSTWSFFVFGLGSIVATCVVLLVFFRRKGWV